MKIGCVILAAGSASRFGQLKQLYDVDGRTLLNRVVDCYVNSSLSSICVVLGADAVKIAEYLPEGIEAVICEDWHKGMTASLSCGLVALLKKSSQTEIISHVLIGLGDHLGITEKSLANLVDAAQHNPSKIIATDYNKILGAPAIFPFDYIAPLMTLSATQNKGAQAYIMSHLQHVVKVSLPEAQFDIDTPKDLLAWKNSLTEI
ncbi:nucleotidyltransferase family protein [Aliiglaciecola sp. LCG003]|uniref:nucleotidyltransferase family protein n=1 Tax=Aliiglaciecola sp. LCG003 TaxID=3053655 RepID=UPI0025733CA8|nr:nucleotidyltransferase family protein [Aliiglaciecola sp. LCG003]WJG07763.1 nucleotidyltransferase family protein [Aliiglaciecola sp. LCG003]